MTRYIETLIRQLRHARRQGDLVATILLEQRLRAALR